MEAIGPEPVSPHYESFFLSRRFPLLAAFGCYFMQIMEDLNPGSFYGKSVTFNFYTLMLLGVGILESRYLLMKIPGPKLTWFYDSYHELEYMQLVNNWYDSLEEAIRIFTAKSKEQIDYYLVHQEYIYVKKRLLTSFLENERKALSENFNQRTVSLLNTIVSLENGNIKRKLSDITEQALNTVLNKVKDSNNNKDIIDSSFESALLGLRKGEMKYEGDTLLPMFLEELKKRSEPFAKLSQEEENKLFALSDDQRKYLVSLDNSAKAAYLNKVPDLAASLKNNQVYGQIVQRMKSRVESSLKH